MVHSFVPAKKLPTTKRNGLYIALISVHGLIRANNLELGRDSDTGGQTTYVLELTRSLARQPDVARVDLFTRRIFDKRVDSDYAQPVEPLDDKGNIIRCQCGPKRYLRKEMLWPYLDEFTNEMLKHFRSVGRLPDVIHAHYADAGHVGRKLSQLLGAPLLFTGHSLGRVKRERLFEQGAAKEKIETKYNIHERIEAEEMALSNAAMVVTSTNQEIEEQYKLYENYHPQQKVVIPPGTDISRFSPSRASVRSYGYLENLRPFLSDPFKPMVLAISRADERKNISGLIHAYANHAELRKLANLVIVAGNRDDLKEMESGQRDVFRKIFYLIDKYDLYGSVAYPKHHTVDDVPDLYRMCAKSGGVFVNPALTEPFGLTLIEAAACGTPIVATNDGGPRDITAHCKNGELIDPLDTEGISATIYSMLNDPARLRRYSQNGLKGVKKHYTWESHTKTYLKEIRRNILKTKGSFLFVPSGKRLLEADRLFITDIDNTLLGDAKALRELVKKLRAHSNQVGIGIATGRHLESAIEVLSEWDVPRPDVLITSVGSEIHYGDDLKQDMDWRRHIDYKWEPERLRDYMANVPGLELQPESNQREFKVSYLYDAETAPPIREIKKQMRESKFRIKIIISHDAYLDFLPLRASKGLAVWYLANKWGVPMERILTAGDSGNDEEMLKGHGLSVVVGNYSKELESLRKNPTVYFAEGEYAAGILEAMDYFQFFGDINIPEVGNK
ncbi:MAG: HAD-IIB family hydrolase [Candidatus Hinthialibacter antarcticus]|nr:HAD-IIB family hydrolase [Candidatus Hinthialibacter antarcticus]